MRFADVAADGLVGAGAAAVRASMMLPDDWDLDDDEAWGPSADLGCVSAGLAADPGPLAVLAGTAAVLGPVVLTVAEFDRYGRLVEHFAGSWHRGVRVVGFFYGTTADAAGRAG